MAASYPAGTAYTYSPGHPQGVVVPPSGMPDAPSSDIEFVTKASSFLNNASRSHVNVFSFHNSMQDALANGTLSKYSLASSSGLVNSMPSDWVEKYSSSPEGLDNMLQDINGLVNVSHQIWSDKPSPLGPTSDWNLQSVDSHDMYIKTSQAQNQGTHKDGMADHPDYNNVNHMEAKPDSDHNVIGELTLGYGAYKAGASAFQKGVSALTGSGGEMAGLGEAEMIEAGMAVGEGAAIGTAEVIGAATGVGLVAAGALGLAVAGYEVYKAFGGTGKVPLLDKIGHTFTSFL